MDQDAILQYKFDLVEAKGWGMNEEVDLWIQSTSLDKDIIEVLAILEGKLLHIKVGHCLLKGGVYIVGIGGYSKLIYIACK